MAESVEDSQILDDFVINLNNVIEDAEFTVSERGSHDPLHDHQIPGISALSTPDLSLASCIEASPTPVLFKNDECPSLSPMLSASSSYSEIPGGIPFSPSSSASSADESWSMLVSPSDVFHDQRLPLKKKRGRKPKAESGLYDATSKQQKERRPKAYEISQPFEDKEQERKRINAINARRHRELQKKAREDLELQLAEVRAERDILLQEIETLKMKETELERQLQQL